MLGETDENWQRLHREDARARARQRHHLPDGAALQHDDQQGPPAEDRPVRPGGRQLGHEARAGSRRRSRRSKRAGLSRRQRLHGGEGPGAHAASSTAIGCGRGPTWPASAWRRSATSTACTCRTWTRGRPTARPSRRGELPLGRAYRPTDEERMIRELVLQLKRGSIRPAYFADKYGVDIARRASASSSRRSPPKAISPRPTPDARRADARRPAARGLAAPPVLPAAALRHPLHVARMTDRPVSEHACLQTRRVQFRETDAAGLVHFSSFFRYMEEAEHALWRAAGLSIHPRRRRGRAGRAWPRRSSSTGRCASRTSSRSASAIAEMTKRTIRYTVRHRPQRRRAHRDRRADDRLRAASVPDEPMKAMPTFPPTSRHACSRRDARRPSRIDLGHRRPHEHRRRRHRRRARRVHRVDAARPAGAHASSCSSASASRASTSASR